MKKIMVSLILIASIAISSYAANMPTDKDYENLDELRAKLVRMKREMDRFMKDIISTYPNQAVNAVDVFGGDVKVDVTEGAKDVIVKADLPGMDKDKIEITLMNNKILKIGGSRNVVKEDKPQGVVRQERMSGNFERVLELPAECLNEGITATYDNGVLEVIIPKKKPGEAEAVKIKVL
jgi:HSP20 family protein